MDYLPPCKHEPSGDKREFYLLNTWIFIVVLGNTVYRVSYSTGELIKEELTAVQVLIGRLLWRFLKFRRNYYILETHTCKFRVFSLSFFQT